MKDLIAALLIFSKYTNTAYPTHCEHDTLYICDVDPVDVTEEDKTELDRLGFFVGDEGFISFKFGSA